MPKSDVEWTVAFARDGVRDSIASIVDDATPGLIDRLASDPNAFRQLLAVTKMVVDEGEELLRETAISARHAGLNWERIGEAMGMTRQEAQKRFSPRPTDDDDAAAQFGASGNAVDANGLAANAPPGSQQIAPGTRIVIPLASDEMSVLNQLGSYGWHGVGFTSSTWTIAFDPTQQWEHAYTMRKPPKRGEGWQQIGRWGLMYWRRPTGEPILPGAPDPRTFVGGNGAWFGPVPGQVTTGALVAGNVLGALGSVTSGATGGAVGGGMTGGFSSGGYGG
ncbi:MAG: hypothetical protein FWG25_07990 [Promicromonosporaceae bacterium]|nr:hypothetical protein [Promicromonosporaceae bacterium]